MIRHTCVGRDYGSHKHILTPTPLHTHIHLDLGSSYISVHTYKNTKSLQLLSMDFLVNVKYTPINKRQWRKVRKNIIQKTACFKVLIFVFFIYSLRVCGRATPYSIICIFVTQ